MKRVVVLLACVLVSAMTAASTAASTASAGWAPRAHPLPPRVGVPSPRHNALPGLPAGLPAGCYFSGPLSAALPSASSSSVSLRYLGMTYTPPCDPAGVLKISLNLYAWNGTVWVFGGLFKVGVDSDGLRISPGTLTVPCSHLARVRAVINYKVATTTITVTTNARQCS